MKLSELRAVVAELRDEAVALSELDDITPEQDERLDAVIAEIEAREVEIAKVEAREAVLERAAVTAAKVGEQPELRADFHAPNFVRKDKATGDDFRSMSTKQLVDAVTRNVEDRDIDPDHARSLFKRHQSDRQWLAGLAFRST